MFCQRCGRDNPADVTYCQGCGNPIYTAQAQPPPVHQGYAHPGYPPPGYGGYGSYPVGGPASYAGIGSRFLAMLIDGIIVGIPIGILSTVLSAMMAARVITRTSGRNYNPGMAATDVGTFFAGFGFIMILSFLVTWAYFAMMESSAWQGTVGKRIMGIRVTDMNGARISLGKATLRLAIKAFLSGWFLIGYIMAFFTQRKQALHDLIAGTLILSGPAIPAAPVVTPYGGQYPGSVSPPPAPTMCSNCGASLQPGARFCSNCGQNL